MSSCNAANLSIIDASSVNMHEPGTPIGHDKRKTAVRRLPGVCPCSILAVPLTPSTCSRAGAPKHVRGCALQVVNSQSHNVHKAVAFEPLAPAALFLRILITFVVIKVT